VVATKGLAHEWPVQAGGGNWGMKQTEFRTVITVTYPQFDLGYVGQFSIAKEV
jgi:hypothetical protein